MVIFYSLEYECESVIMAAHGASTSAEDEKEKLMLSILKDMTHWGASRTLWNTARYTTSHLPDLGSLKFGVCTDSFPAAYRNGKLTIKMSLLGQ